jgi:choline dehydrogenase-like flavoprotein
VLPHAGFVDLKDQLDDPSAFFLGSQFEGVVLPDAGGEYYGFPPDKDYVFRRPPRFGYTAAGFAPLFSFARGGLAEAWTGGCYPLNDDDLRDFPWGYAALEPHYAEVARRIGVTGEPDDLARFMPLHANLGEPLALDRHSELLLAAYAGRRDYFQNVLGCWVGRTRVATLSQPKNARGGCDYLGRCLFGCPVDALYTPSLTLRELLAHPRFTYRGGMVAEFFRVDARRRATTLVLRPVEGSASIELEVDQLVLAAGTLSSTTIMLRSAYEETGELVRLPGLMDNRQVLVPFANLRLIGIPYEPERYQYHLLGLGLASAEPERYIHGQITTLKTALMHPIIQKLPFDLRLSARLARATHAALGVVNLNFPDTRREANEATLVLEDGSPRLALRYTPPPGEAAEMRRVLRRTRRALWALGCVVPPGMTHVRPMGASVHYAGTLPMSSTRRPWTTTANGQSHDYENVFLVDGSTFPFLPSKNLTFTLMANAVRIATSAM